MRADEQTRTAYPCSLRVRFAFLHLCRKVACIQRKTFAAYRCVAPNNAEVRVSCRPLSRPRAAGRGCITLSQSQHLRKPADQDLRAVCSAGGPLAPCPYERLLRRAKEEDHRSPPTGHDQE